ncbi:MAG: hypothetical protein R8K50_01510 [Mariprofundus sp.]
MVRTLLILIALYIIFRLYKRTFLEKTCFACKQHIRKEAPICHHCNTIQAEGIVIDSQTIKRESNPPSSVMMQLKTPVALTLLGVIAAAAIAAVYFLG